MSYEGTLPRDAAAYAGQLRQLLPRGLAWEFGRDSVFAQLLAGLAEELARVDARGLDMLEEADPRTALELLPDWERVAGLPDACTGRPDNAGERQAALQQKLTGLGGQSRQAFIELAARLGYVIWIEEHRPARVGARIGDCLNGPDFAFCWTVHVRPFDGYLEEATFIAQAQIGDRLGVRLRGFGAIDLECVIARARPAHTIVLFAYDVEPSAAFWFDFTG